MTFVKPKTDEIFSNAISFSASFESGSAKNSLRSFCKADTWPGLRNFQTRVEPV